VKRREKGESKGDWDHANMKTLKLLWAAKSPKDETRTYRK